jgi:SAM-dependent methyltransferase
MSSEMGRFWDKRAEEDAFWFVDSRLSYGAPDLQRFWADGEVDLDRLLRALGESVDPGDEVVEIGCGVGRLSRVLAARAASVRALDVSPRMLELAREHNAALKNVEWILGDGSSLAGIDSESADACVSHVVFQHIPDPSVTMSYIREIGRALKPGGWAAFQISNDPRVHQTPGWRYRARQALLVARGRAPHGQVNRNWRGSMLEISQLRQAASDGSMNVERIVGEGNQLCLVLTRRTT